MVDYHRMTSALFGRRASPSPPPRPGHRSPRQRFTLEPLEGRALLSYLTLSVPDNVVAETPFTMTATVFRDDQTVDTDYTGDVDVGAESYWQLAGHGYENFVGSSIDGPSTVTAVSGVATFNWTVDPAPEFRLTASAIVPDPNVEGGYTTIMAQADLHVAPFPDQLTFIEPPPSSLVAGAPFSMTVAAVDSSGNIDTSFNQLVGLGGIDSRVGYWGNNPPIDGVRFVSASAGVATFTGLSVEHGTPRDAPATYDVWSPDIFGRLGFSVAVTGPATQFAPYVYASPTPPDTSIVAGHAFSVSALAFDTYWNFASSFNGNVTIALANNPAGANLGGTLTVAAANGVVNFSDLTLDKPGTDYTLQITSDGLSPVTTMPFTVQTAVGSSVGVNWGTSGSATLQTTSDGLRLLPAGRNTDMPWLGIQQVHVNLAQSAALTAGDITVVGASPGLINYGPVTVAGSGTSYTITLAQPIDAADRVTLTIGNELIAGFTRRLDVLPGDVNDDAVVNAQDMVLIRNAIQKIGDPLMIGWADVDGDGVVGMNDYTAARRKLGSRLA